MGNDPQSALKIPLILVILGLIGYVGTSYWTHRQEISAIRTDFETTRKSLSENLTVLQQQSDQRYAALQKLSQDYDSLQKKVSEIDQVTQTEKSERVQLLLAQQESISQLKEQQLGLVKNLAQAEMEIKESKEVQAEMIPTALETRKLQQQIDSLKQLLDSQSARITNLQEQISTRNSMPTQSVPTKSTNPLRNGFP
ncbi:MAG: hypothetical protein V4507_04605 [Verrucomicrobiota bacterium]